MIHGNESIAQSKKLGFEKDEYNEPDYTVVVRMEAISLSKK